MFARFFEYIAYPLRTLYVKIFKDSLLNNPYLILVLFVQYNAFYEYTYMIILFVNKKG